MMALSRPRWSGSIFGHTLLLVMCVVMIMAALSAATILIRPPPAVSPLSMQELAQLLRGERLRSSAAGLTVRVVRGPELPRDGDDPLARMRKAILAEQLGVPPENVRFARTNGSGTLLGMTRTRTITIVVEGGRMAPPRKAANLIVAGSFTAALRLADGRWRVVSREWGGPLQRWQLSTIGLFLLMILLILPVAWLFSSRIAKPIHAFSRAADRLGHDHKVEPVDVTGPREIRLAATALNDMQRRLQLYVKERTTMVGAIAHDLRTPLSRLQFLLESAPEQTRRKGEAEISEMEKMIASILEFVENETREQQLEEIDLGLLIQSIADDLADSGHDVRVSAAQQAIVRADPLVLRRLFSNLIVNAIVYGGSAEIRMTRAGRRILIDVLDKGPGLDEQDLERVFAPFYRTETSRNRATGGIGLGLSIVKAAVAASDGSVKLSNRPEGGLCARICLPLSSHQSGDTTADVVPERTGAPCFTSDRHRK